MDLLDTRDRLLFSQAVYEHGSDSWALVAQILIDHPLTHYKNFNPEVLAQLAIFIYPLFTPGFTVVR